MGRDLPKFHDLGAERKSGKLYFTENGSDRIGWRSCHLEIICTSGYTQCVRNVPSKTKTTVYKSYGLTGNHTGYCDSDQGCEVDHLISLELGGSNDQKTLWPEPYQGEQFNAHVKDQLENWYHAQVCSGQMPLIQAQQEISSNWIEAYQKHLGGQH
jgi:hypothetical protein